MGSPAAEPKPIITTNSNTDNCLIPLLPKIVSPTNITVNITTVLRTVSGKNAQSSEPSNNSFQEICIKNDIVIFSFHMKKPDQIKDSLYLPTRFLNNPHRRTGL